MKFTLSVVLDLYFFSLISFFIAITWLRYFLSSTILIVLLGVIFAIFVALLLIIIKLKNQKNYNLNKKQKFEFDYLKQTLLTNNLSYVLSFLEKIFALRKNSTNLNKIFNTFYFNKHNNYFIGSNCCLCFNFDYIKINEQTIKNIILELDKCNLINNFTSSKKIKTIYILANDFKESCNEYINLLNTNIKLINLNYFYKEIIYGLNIFPAKQNCKIKRIHKLKDFSKNLFNPNQTKAFLMCGLCIFIAGFIVRYNIYYIIFSSILFLCAIICKLKKVVN